MVMSTETPLADRVAVVTGATSGIGAATAIALAAAGASVVLAGRRADRGEAVVETIRSTGGTAMFVPTDVREPADIGAMVDAAVTEYGHVDIAFNNAGIFDRMHDFHTYADDAWDEMLAVNLTAVFRCMKAELAAMAGRGGVIVNNASTVGHRGSERASPSYVAAKHGVIGLTKQAAIEYATRGIRVNAVSPGPTRTEVSDALVAEGPEAVAAALAKLNPTSQFVDAADVAQAVVYLCSDAAAMINGHSLVLDGGQLAGL